MAFSDSGIAPGRSVPLGEKAACFLVFSLKYAKFYDIVVVVFTFHSPILPAERKHP